MTDGGHSDDLVELTIEVPRPADRVRLIRLEGLEPRRTSRDALRLSSLDQGDRVTPAALETALAEAEPAAALERAVRLLGHRERSRLELATRLDADGYPETVIDSVIERLTGWGYLDDSRYAEGFVRTKRAAGWGRGRILRSLRESGIAQDAAIETLDRLLPEAGEVGRASALLRAGCGNDPRERQRQIARLVRKGFSYQVARSAVGNGCDPPDEF